jgi:hypothetical protein
MAVALASAAWYSGREKDAARIAVVPFGAAPMSLVDARPGRESGRVLRLPYFVCPLW